MIAQGATLGTRTTSIALALKGRNKKLCCLVGALRVEAVRVVPGRCPSLSHLSPLGTCVRHQIGKVIRSCSFATRVSMTNAIKLLDVVALTVDLPEYNLRRGQVGTVVEILAEDNAFEVEFSDRAGRTFESLG